MAGPRIVAVAHMRGVSALMVFFAPRRFDRAVRGEDE